jgi:hypothetical protein
MLVKLEYRVALYEYVELIRTIYTFNTNKTRAKSLISTQPPKLQHLCLAIPPAYR